jgi:hypothetical protein
LSRLPISLPKLEAQVYQRLCFLHCFVSPRLHSGPFSKDVWWMRKVTFSLWSVIRRFPNSLSLMEESMAGHVGVKGVY